ncbi:MAG TPA: DUF3179 domain-containing (seleno)protein [Ohtaekwangia sp.]|nr:DUF3179 domain-containing (seleno)protein [Ohtaekwangia sp.]
MKALQFGLGIVLLVAIEILRVYYIMPFPGSQRSETLEFAYFIDQYIWYLRTMGFLLIIFPVWYFVQFGGRASKWTVGLSLVLVVVVIYLFNFRFLADKMFLEPENKVFRKAADNAIPLQRLVLGITINGESSAYPIELIGYHHQVRDSVGGEPVMITYCTVCRTGRAFSPVVDGKAEIFRLVGMDHFNAMFEDASTKSWWRQVNGEAVAGPLKGHFLKALPSEQMSLSAWIRRHPDTRIMQADSTFSKAYAEIKLYYEGRSKGDLTRRDSLSWNDKSWVVGVQHNGMARAYDWNDLIAFRVLNDTLGGSALLVALEADSVSFHVWQRDTLDFGLDLVSGDLIDQQTRSHWNWEGVCTDGPLAGRTLPAIQSYQEFWHSWKTFRPGTTRFTTGP